MTAQPARPDSQDDLAEDEDAFEAAFRGEAVSHDAVKRWLASKDTPAPAPCPSFGE